ncbi:hypothetical protein V6N13_134467 [Hibiscus sabdariffa]
METSEGGRAVAMEFPASETPSFSRVPRRIRKRLLSECKTPTVGDIEARLRHADLRRQQFIESVSSKARSKPRSPSRSPSNEEDLGQRLEARLQAAEQKRLDMLAKAQMRLAKLDELRQAAKTGVEKRVEKEREKLGTKVESRFQQAEANRMLILKACSQRRATLNERSSQSLSRRMVRESKYKERVRAAIHQKRAAAEKKRLSLLDAEKKKACARFLQARRVAKSISHQREVERRRMRDQLEDRLQRARRQRTEYLRQRVRTQKSIQVNCTRMHKQADMLSRKLARCWRRFLRQRKTTLDLAKAYGSLKINKTSVKLMPFEQLALLIESMATLQTVKALLDRVESRVKASRVGGAADHLSGLDNIDHLLKRVATPKRKTTPRTSMRSREGKRVASVRETAKSFAKLSRYPVRVVLCAYMILGHPNAVLSGQGEREVALAKSAEAFVQEFELLVKIILEGPIQNSDKESQRALPRPLTFRSQLAAFDKAWCSYLNCFAMWKVKDAQLLEEDLVRAACQLELSMIQKCKVTLEGDDTALTHDMKAIQRQVVEDQKLLREKVQHLSGDVGIERMECALSETRANFFQAKESGSPIGSPLMSFTSANTHGTPSSSTDRTDNRSGQTETQNRVVRTLFKENGTSSSKNCGSSVPCSSQSDAQLGSSTEKHTVTKNELIVNEFLHGQCGFVDNFSAIDEDKNNIKAKMREMMEKAFWDGIMESMQQDEPDFDRVIELVREVRDEICELAPRSWREEITDAIDLEILSQVLKSGKLDIAYLGRILEFALITLQKLSSPANDDEIKTANQSRSASNVTGHEQPECMGERVDLLVRLGLLKLVSGISGLTPEALPETFTLNFSRLRGVQAEIQKIIVISTSILIFRQILSSEQVVASSADMESITSNCGERLLEFLDHVNDAGIEGIIETISGIPRDGDKVTDDKILQTRKAMMARMLAKSLQARDPVFEKVSRAVYLAFRGILLGGSGTHGRQLAEIALRRVGAGSLTKRVVKEAKVLVVAATVSVRVHGQWYATLIGNM